jgi:hypothetical protein
MTTITVPSRLILYGRKAQLGIATGVLWVHIRKMKLFYFLYIFIHFFFLEG